MASNTSGRLQLSALACVCLALGALAEQPKAGTCKAYGCSYDFKPEQTCQCYSGCVQEQTCCTDYKTVCDVRPSPPPPPGPGLPGHVVWRSSEYGPGTSGRGIDDEPPVIYNGNLYFVSALQLWTMFALDAKTGKEIWSVMEPNTTAATAPAVANGTLYYADVGQSLVGTAVPRLRALDAETGTVKWQLGLPAGTIQDHPVVADGVVYIILTAEYEEVSAPLLPPLGAPPTMEVNGSCRVYGCGPEYKQNQTCQCNPGCRSYGNCCADYCMVCPPPSPPPPPPPRTFLAIEAESGRLRWSTNVSASQTSPAVANGIVYVSSALGSVYAFNTTTGLLIWTAHEINNQWFTPVIADGLVFASEEQGLLHAVDALTGKPVWNRTFEGYNALAPAVADETLYLAGAFDTLYVVDYTAVMESQLTVGAPNRPSSSRYAFNTKTGALKWNATRLCTGHLWSTPAVADGTVYVGADDGHLQALDAMTGKRLWNFTAPTSVRSPAVYDGMVYFGINLQMSPGSEDQLFALLAKAT